MSALADYLRRRIRIWLNLPPEEKRGCPFCDFAVIDPLVAHMNAEHNPPPLDSKGFMLTKAGRGDTGKHD